MGFCRGGVRDLDYRHGAPSTRFEAFRLSAGWFVTGDKPDYKSRIGAWDPPKVRRPATAGGPGAVELLARWETLDYTDAPLGGQGSATTLGVNWCLNDFTRLMLNGIFWRVDNAAGVNATEDDGATVAGETLRARRAVRDRRSAGD